MRTLKRILFFIAGICLIIACSKSDHFWGDEPLGNTIKGGHSKPVIVTVPFKMEGDAIYTALYEDLDFCGAYPLMRIIAGGPSEATHLGKVTTYADFCCNIVTSIFGVPEPAIVRIVAANGDELLVSTVGQVFPRDENDPPYVLEKWVATFEFAGGTGRFEGATGEGKYIGYNYVDSDTPLGIACHTIFEGTLTLVKGKQ